MESEKVSSPNTRGQVIHTVVPKSKMKDYPCPCSNMSCPCGCGFRYSGICLRPYPCKLCMKAQLNSGCKY